jgi:hypothetical protein
MKSFSRMMLLFCVVAMMVFLISGCQKKSLSPLLPENEAKEPGQNEQGYSFVAIQNPEQVTHNTFSIFKPKEWQEIQYSSNTLVYLASGSSINDSFSEKISMIVGFLPENETRTLEELTQLELAKSKELMPDMQIISQEPCHLGQLDGIRLLFTTRIQDRIIEVTQLRAGQGNRVYAFSNQCEKGNCQYKGIFYDMATSFEWKNP